MNFKFVLDRKLGARLRAALAIATSVITALSVVAAQLDAIPEGTPLASSVLLLASALVTALGRFSSIGNEEGEN